MSVSVVIPALNEQDGIARALESTRRRGVERIVVDGGSSDGTRETARFLGAEKVIQTAPGRARQLDAGWRVAGGEVVVFVHADSRLDPGWLDALAEVLVDPGVAGGAFRLHFESRSPVYRAVDAWARLRSWLFRLPFGDQALFVRRKHLEAGGGIADTPIFEDLDLVRQIRRCGRLVLLAPRVYTSTRRYERNGLLRQGVRNLAALAMWRVGVPRERVVQWYRSLPSR